MQLRPVLIAASLATFAAGLGFAESEATMVAGDPQAEYLMQLFSDSDEVAVRSLIGNCSIDLSTTSALALRWNNEQVVIPAIEAPAGSQEAVDAITTASRPISGNAYQEFAKTRNEFVGEVVHDGTALGYYLSSEVDYVGQQLTVSHNRDFDEQRLNLSAGVSYGWDAIKPLADDDTQGSPDHKNTVHFNAVATRVLSPVMVLRVGFEYNIVDGLQHNPYRNVYAGGTNVAERHPDQRHRCDAFAKLNRYMGNRSSLKVHYRFYNDDWGISSHEAGTQLSQHVTRGLFATYQYRFYTQTPARFQREEYETTSGVDGYLTGDYRMSDLDSHLFGVALDFDLNGLAFDHAVLRRLGFRVDYERYFNSLNYSANIFTTQLIYRF